MGAETIGGHMVRSLANMLDGLQQAEKTGKKVTDDDADEMLAELDRLIALMREDAPE